MSLTEADYLAELSRCVRESGGVMISTLSVADEAVAAFPGSVRLWCRRGDLIQLGPEGNPHTLEDAQASYERALEIDPDDCEALESLGHFFDAVTPNPALAEHYLVRSIGRCAGKHAFISLAELYLERGDTAEAIELLGPERCPFAEDPQVVAIRQRATEQADEGRLVLGPAVVVAETAQRRPRVALSWLAPLAAEAQCYADHRRALPFIRHWRTIGRALRRDSRLHRSGARDPRRGQV